MTGDHKRRIRTPTKGWHEIASGDIGDILHWQPGYEVLQRGESAISLLENLDVDSIDWDYLTHRLSRFACLKHLIRERAFEFLAWDHIDGFSAVEGDRQEETGSMSGEWTQMWLWMNHDHKRKIFRDFEELICGLECTVLVNDATQSELTTRVLNSRVAMWSQ